MKPARLAPLIETLVLLAIMVALDLWLFPHDPGFVRLSPHPTLFIVLLVLVRYGLTAGIAAAALATATHFVLVWRLAEVPTYLHLVRAPYSTPVVVLWPTTVVLGVLVERHLRRARAAERRGEALARENARLSEEQGKLRDVNVELAGKVQGAGGTLAALYRYAKVLNVD